MTQPAAAGLVDQQVGFLAALRAAGVPVSAAEGVDAGRGLAAVGLADRGRLRAAFAATLLKRPAHRPAFDLLFDLWFPPAVGAGAAGTAPPAAGGATPVGPAGAPAGGAPGEPDAALVAEWRVLLARLLRDDDDPGLRRLARAVVNRFAPVRSGRAPWFAGRLERALSPETLLAGLLEELVGPRRGGLAEQVARVGLQERIDRFHRYLAAELRRRAAEQRGPHAVARDALPLPVEQVDFLRANATQLAELRRGVYPLARRLATRLAAHRRTGNRGRLDFRRTVRASLSTGGVPVLTRHRPRRPRRPELTLLCDVSGSVAGFANFTLSLVYALADQFSRVRAFAFVDTTDEITDLCTAAGGIHDLLHGLGNRARVVWYDGHSDYGHAFETFADSWPDAVGARTALLVLGDARNNYRDPGLPTLRALAGRARRAHWLNPEPKQHWDSGDSLAADYRLVVDMVECRNLGQLQDFVGGLLPG